MAERANTDTLSATLQSAASRAAELAGDGASVLFTVEPLRSDEGATKSPRLRSAAGFDSPDSARLAASAVLESVHECLSRGSDAETVRAGAPANLEPRVAD